MLTSNDLALIKINNSHYFIKRDKIVNKIDYNDRTFFNKFERVDEFLSPQLIKEHLEKKNIIAHNLISASNHVENIVFDYNGFNTDKFWHRAQLLLREEGFINFTAYKSKTLGHLHLYIHKGHTSFNEGCSLANRLSAMLAQKMPVEWRVFPTLDMPREYNILALPYEIYQKERGASWSKHM